MRSEAELITSPNASQNLPKPIENRALGPACATLGPSWASLGLSWASRSPKRASEDRPKEPKKGYKKQLGSNLEAQGGPKSKPKREKMMFKSNPFLASIFGGLGRRFGRVFSRFFGSFFHRDADRHIHIATCS